MTLDDHGRESVAERRAARHDRRGPADEVPPPALDINDPAVAQALARSEGQRARMLADTYARGPWAKSPAAHRHHVAQATRGLPMPGVWPAAYPAIAAQAVATILAAHARRLVDRPSYDPTVTVTATADGAAINVGTAWLRLRLLGPHRADPAELITGPAGLPVVATPDQLRAVAAHLYKYADAMEAHR